MFVDLNKYLYKIFIIYTLFYKNVVYKNTEAQIC